jgi:hypothetical protein
LIITSILLDELASYVVVVLRCVLYQRLCDDVRDGDVTTSWYVMTLKILRS